MTVILPFFLLDFIVFKKTQAPNTTYPEPALSGFHGHRREFISLFTS